MSQSYKRTGIALGIAVSLSLTTLVHSSFSASAQMQNVRFGNSSDIGSLDISAAVGALQNWSAGDKKRMTTELAFLNSKFSGLLARCDKLIFFRVKRINPDAELQKLDTYEVTAAATTPGAIFFSDDFFKLEDRELRFFFVHEIVHAADIGNLVAYSPDFTAFALDYSKTVLPKPKVREPLPEELADSFAFYARGGLSKSLFDRYKNKIAPLLTDANQNRNLFNARCGQGIVAQKAKNYKGAISNFSEAVSLFPETPLAHSSLSYCKLKDGDTIGALKENDIAQSCFVSAGVPPSEPRRLTHAYMRALLLIQCKQDVAGAIVLLNDVIAYQPSNEQAVKLRTMCRKKLGTRASKKESD